MKATRIGKVQSGQDIAIFGKYIFAFIDRDPRGNCAVYEIETMNHANGEEPEPICRFRLDRDEFIHVHNNAVCFGNEYYCEGDEFPLLYSNVYYSYHNSEVRYEGVTCVYRITRDGNNFTSKLVQVIEIGFVENRELWKSLPEREDFRPYGNFVADCENNKYYGLVMRDKEHIVRCFTFDLPSCKDGEIDDRYGVKTVILHEKDIKDYFDVEYHPLQGACVHCGKIYSIGGGSESSRYPAELRIIDPIKKTQEFYVNMREMGIGMEPEAIDFAGDTCYYAAGHGDAFILEFEEN